MTEDVKPFVYIAQDSPTHSYWPAEKFGTLRHCLPPRADSNNGLSRVPALLRRALKDFQQDDYLLISGAPLSCAIALAILHEKYDRINVLRWSAQNQAYDSCLLDLMFSPTIEDGNEPDDE